MILKIRHFWQTYYLEIGLGILAFFVSSSLFIFSQLRFPNDDQFILYRYIDNLAIGQGFVFNWGEKVLGSTTPLFTLVGAVFKFLLPASSTPDLVAGLNIIFFTFSAIIFFILSNNFLKNRWLALGSVIIFIFNLARMIPEGMETPLFLLLIFSFLLSLNYQKYYLSAIFLSLTILTRPDAGLVGLLGAIFWWQKVGWRKTIRLTCLSVVIALPWLIFSTWYFGSFIPQSLQTKIHSNDIVFQTNYQALKVQLAHLSRLFWGKFYDPDNIFFQTIFNLGPVVVLILAGGWGMIKRQNWLWVAIPFIYLFSFSLSNPVMFPWYLSEMEPFWLLLIFAGLAWWWPEIKNRWLKIVLIIILVAGPIGSWYQILTTDSQGSKTTLFEAGYYLKNKKVTPNETVAMSNIGITSYIANTKTIDLVGLTNDYAVNFYPVDRTCLTDQLYVIPPKLIQSTKPDWLLAGDGEMDPCFLKGEWFKKWYSLEHKIDSFGIYRHR